LQGTINILKLDCIGVRNSYAIWLYGNTMQIKREFQMLNQNQADKKQIILNCRVEYPMHNEKNSNKLKMKNMKNSEIGVLYLILIGIKITI